MGSFWRLRFHSSLGMAMEEEKTAQLNLKRFKLMQKLYWCEFPCDSWASPSHLARPIGGYGFN